MRRLVKGYRPGARVALLAGLLGLTTGAFCGSVRADTSIASSALSTGDIRFAPALEVIKSEPLYRFQDRPYLRIPIGVAFWVRAPRGLTAADLHNQLENCAERQPDPSSPWCVKGASVSVERRGGQYVVRITSDDRAVALEIQKRAASR